MVAVTLEHVAAGVNRVANALHWGDAGLVAFAAHNAVVVYDVEEARVLATLLGHTDRVNCVRWFSAADLGLASHHRPGAPTLLASGAGDASIRLWLWQPAAPATPWARAALLEGHTAPVTSLTTFPLGGDRVLLVSTAAGADEVLVWECDPGAAASGAGVSCGGGGPAAAAGAQGAWRLRQRIAVGLHMQGCAAVARLPADPGWLLLALGGVDSQVRLLACPPGGEFAEACRLAGHQDWVRGLAFAQMDDGRLLLASASQDKNVRIWAVAPVGQEGASAGAGVVAAAAADSSAGDQPPLAASLLRYAPKPRIWTEANCYVAVLEALLVGHEDWVHSVAWQPAAAAARSGGSSSTHTPCLLSASMDRTMMLWRPDKATGLWMAEESVGDAGTLRLGYYTGVFSPDGASILAHGYTGALHLWARQRNGGLAPRHALGGHYGPVVDACWAADGGCLLTVSADQTARLTARAAGGRWCEIARPQVHGHDFSCVAALPPPPPGAPFLYASGSEEKVLRVFQGPRAFEGTLALARGRAPAGGAHGSGGVDAGGGGGAAALGATLPALGLSNKAVYVGDAGEGGGGTGLEDEGGLGGYSLGGDMLLPAAAPAAVAGPPLEEHLAQNTLWPEIHKLYGHGNDVYCIAADPRGRYLASACRAQSADAAAVWLWDTARWTGAGSLPAHALTVTQLAFSPDGALLASASRGRSVALFQRQGEGASAAGAPPFRPAGKLPKAHARVVWSVHWSPDGALLATGSRDGNVKVWSVARGGGADAALPQTPAAVLPLGGSVRSVAWAPDCCAGALYYLAAGLEDGSLQLLRLSCAAAPGGGAACGDGREGGPQQQPTALQHDAVWVSSIFTQHAAAVRRLCWRRRVPAEGEEGGEYAAQQPAYHLASVGDDHAIRVFGISLPNLAP
eukprot:scaffold1.g5490.t1